MLPVRVHASVLPQRVGQMSLGVTTEREGLLASLKVRVRVLSE